VTPHRPIGQALTDWTEYNSPQNGTGAATRRLGSTHCLLFEACIPFDVEITHMPKPFRPAITDLDSILAAEQPTMQKILEAKQPRQDQEERDNRLSRLWFEAEDYSAPPDKNWTDEQFARQWAVRIKTLIEELVAQGYLPWLVEYQTQAVNEVQSFNVTDDENADSDLSFRISRAAAVTVLLEAQHQALEEIATAMLKLRNRNFRVHLGSLGKAWRQRRSKVVENPLSKKSRADVVALLVAMPKRIADLRLGLSLKRCGSTHRGDGPARSVPR
jgi:hypothetical protein